MVKMNKKMNLILRKNGDSFEKQKKDNLNPRYYECSKCNGIVTLETSDLKNIELECPICGQKTFSNYHQNNQIKTMKDCVKSAGYLISIQPHRY
jgi:DNA-directed RNA polymerase subunit RPC12/RpoP